MVRNLCYEAQGIIRKYILLKGVLFMKKIICIVLAALMLAAAAAGCSQKVSIVGTWECTDENMPHEWPCYFVFTEEGRFTDRDGDTGYWEKNDGYLLLRWDNYPPYEMKYTLTPNTLTIESSNTHVRLARAEN